nr:MAG TPA: hypothetical protein [Caudoviricetes sp.]
MAGFLRFSCDCLFITDSEDVLYPAALIAADPL